MDTVIVYLLSFFSLKDVFCCSWYCWNNKVNVTKVIVAQGVCSRNFFFERNVCF